MTIAEWCLLAAALMPLFTIAAVKAGAEHAFDNADPRDPAFYKDGIRRRAWSAHLNGFESFPFFAAAVLLAEIRHAPQAMIDFLALGFIALRLIYTALYLGNLPTLRTAVFSGGLAVNIAIFVLPAFFPAPA